MSHQVWKAEADDLSGYQGTTRLVAVKTVKEGASEREKQDLVRELQIMQRVGSHPNVVTLLGCCTEQGEHFIFRTTSDQKLSNNKNKKPFLQF